MISWGLVQLCQKHLHDFSISQRSTKKKVWKIISRLTQNDENPRILSDTPQKKSKKPHQLLFWVIHWAKSLFWKMASETKRSENTPGRMKTQLQGLVANHDGWLLTQNRFIWETGISGAELPPPDCQEASLWEYFHDWWLTRNGYAYLCEVSPFRWQKMLDCIRKQAEQIKQSKHSSVVSIHFLTWALALASLHDGLWVGPLGEPNEPFPSCWEPDWLTAFCDALMMRQSCSGADLAWPSLVLDLRLLKKLRFWLLGTWLFFLKRLEPSVPKPLDVPSALRFPVLPLYNIALLASHWLCITV